MSRRSNGDRMSDVKKLSEWYVETSDAFKRFHVVVDCDIAIDGNRRCLRCGDEILPGTECLMSEMNRSRQRYCRRCSLKMIGVDILDRP